MRDTFLLLYFQQGATINRNRFNSIFSSLDSFVIQVRLLTTRPIKYSGFERRCSVTIFSTKHDNKSKSLQFNIFFACFTRYTSTSTNRPLKFSRFERRCSESIFSTRRDKKSISLQFNIFFAAYTRYTS